MTAKPVLRMERVQTMKAVRLMSRHWLRTQTTENADATMQDGIRLLHGSGDVPMDVQTALDRLTRPARKDSCISIEVLCSASEEHFRPEGGVPYSRDPERIEAWTQATMQHLRTEFGDNLVAAVLHLDEQTPHIQALLVPLEEKFRAPAGRAKDKTPKRTIGLNADSVMGNRDTLSGRQQSYETAMSSLGIGPRTKKTIREPDRSTVREWYARGEEATRSKEQDAAAAQSAREQAERAAVRNVALVRTVEATLDGRITAAPDDERGRRLTLTVKDPQERAELAAAIRPAGSQGWEWASRFFSMQKAERERVRTQTLDALARYRETAASIAKRLLRVRHQLTETELKEASRAISAAQLIAPQTAEKVRRTDLDAL